MIDPSHVPGVAQEEVLARYILQGSHLRRGDQTVKPDAFVPHPHLDLSVTRHLAATEDELWSVGGCIAAARTSTLHGRADVPAAACLRQKLVVHAAPLANNPNHANISGWPNLKPAQKAIAQELAACATFVARQPS
jgi:hypothetical protein